MERAGLHVVVETMLKEINPQLPFWLHHGVSAFLGGWLDRGQALAIIRRVLSMGKLREPPKLSEGRTPTGGDRRVRFFDDFRGRGGYVLSMLAVQHLESTYGRKALAEFLRNPTDYEGVLGVPEREFWAGWKDYIRRYKRGGTG